MCVRPTDVACKHSLRAAIVVVPLFGFRVLVVLKQRLSWLQWSLWSVLVESEIAGDLSSRAFQQ